MEHIEQLKNIRSDAIARLRASDDYKLAGKLGALIVELGEELDTPLDYPDRKLGSSSASVAAPAGATASAPFSSLPGFSSGEAATDDGPQDESMIDELVAEMQNEAEKNDSSAGASLSRANATSNGSGSGR